MTRKLWRIPFVRSTRPDCLYRNFRLFCESHISAYKGCFHFGTVEFAAVQAAVGGSQVIFDVRNKNEVETHGFIKGSINVPLPEVEEALALEADEFKSKYGSDKPDEATEIITHCMGGGRAQKAGDALVAKGFSNVKVYKGSFSDWKEQGGEIIMPESS